MARVGRYRTFLQRPDRLHRIWNGGGPPPFDLATLPLTLFLRPENLAITHPLVGQTQLLWPSSASIGPSGDGRELFITGIPRTILDDGPSIGPGSPTFLNMEGVNSPFPIFTSSAHTTQLIDTDVISNTELTMTSLINIQTLTTGAGTFADPCVQGVYQPRVAQLVGGALNNKAEMTGNFAVLAAATVSLTVFVLLTGRWRPLNGLEIRVNKGVFFAASMGALSLFGEPYIIGAGGQGAAMNGYNGHFTAAKTWFDTPTCDNIYNSIQATYPGAGLPP